MTEIIAKKRAKLADGRWGWTAIARTAYAMDRTVIGFRKNCIDVPAAWRNGNAGSPGERKAASIISSVDIERAN